MTETILDTVTKYASIGSTVRLNLANAEIVTGIIDSINANIIVICQKNGNIRFIKDKNVDDFEVILSTKEEPLEGTSRQANNINNRIKVTSNDNVTSNDDGVNEPDKYIGNLDQFKLLFQRGVYITQPSINFNITDIDNEKRQELNRIKNKYDYALKIHEVSRLREMIPDLEEISGNTNHHQIYLLCAQFCSLCGDIDRAIKYSQISLSLKNRQAAIFLADIMVSRKNLDKAALFIVHALMVEAGSPPPVEELLIALGSCLFNSKDKEIRGLGQIQSELTSKSEKVLHNAILALALSDKHLNAAQQVAAGNILRASELALDSPVFLPVPTFVVEEKYKIIQHKKDNKKATIEGTIDSYNSSKGYGFIKSDDYSTYFFHFSDIKDYELRTNLGNTNTGHKVFFTSLPRTVGHKYEQAISIGLVELDDLHINNNNFVSQALPSKDEVYKRAKLAEHNKDFPKAKKLYQQVIDKKGQYSNSAIKDLAALFNRLDQSEEAVMLLDKYKNRFTDVESLEKMKVSFYIKAGEYSKASMLLNPLIKRSRTVRDRLNWIKQLAYCHMMDGDIDVSIEIIKKETHKYKNDTQLRELLEKLEGIKLSGRPNEKLEELQNLAGITSGLSSFTQHLIRKCDFAGADETAKARGYFSKRDFKGVINLFDRIDGRRPREKANLLITLAAMTEKSPESAGSNTSKHIGRALSFIGEAATYEGLEKDTIRFYLSESMKLGVQQDLNLRFPLAFFLSSYLSVTPSPGELLKGDIYNVEEVFRKIHNQKYAKNQFLNDLPYLDLYSSDAINLLISIAEKESIAVLPYEYINNREKNKQSIRELIQHEETSLQALIKQQYKTKANFTETSSKLKELSSSTTFQLDRQRLLNLSNIILDCSKYWGEIDYIEKESKYDRANTGLTSLVTNIENSPTKLSFEQLVPLANTVKESIESNFQDYIINTKPDLELLNILSDDYCILDKQDLITLHLKLVSKQGSAPVESLELFCHEDEDLHLIESAYSPEIIKGGEKREITLKIKPSKNQISQEAFTVRCYATYDNRSGKKEKTDDYSFAIRLGTYDNFIKIDNPYQNYSGGRSVEDPHMFKGREPVIKRIIDVVGNGPIGQCFVLYGQKRSGKTSILNQLKRLLPKSNIISITLSLGEVDINLEKRNVNFIQLFIEKIYEYLEDNFDISPEHFPSNTEIVNEPNSSLRKSLRATIKVAESQGISEPRIVLLVDEFTYVYEYISEGSVSPDFMRSWKALLQMELFSAVVVGQDSMPLFKQEFPNEFGVTYDERITYLSRQETTHLSSDPISIDGKSRYRGNALDRLFELTAGSPFYTNIICDRLVNFLNFRHAPFITEADIESVLHGWRGGSEEFSGLIIGSETLPLERFDPLITAAAESVAKITREDYLEVLVAIAKNGKNKASISDLPQMDNLNDILKDMNEREIISIDAAKRYSIRVGLFAEWLSINDKFSGINERHTL